jgi:DNA-3-methyladenine glycosylase II
MNRLDSGAGTGVPISFVRPYDFALSMRAVRSFQPGPSSLGNGLRLPVRIDGSPVIIEVIAGQDETGNLQAFSRPESDGDRVSIIMEWVLFADLDLAPFYRLADGSPGLAPIIGKLQGLKPTRPASLFEMAVVAITEQQLSLASAYQIRNRVVQRFGEPIEDLRVFPEPATLAGATMEELRSCGLSKQKADYIRSLAGNIVAGHLDLDGLKSMDDDKAREAIMGWRGFGRWSADYILVRGLARPDCVPVDDIGIRDVIGRYLGDGRRVTADEAAEKLGPFRPYRGLLAFYLLAYYRLITAAGV